MSKYRSFGEFNNQKFAFYEAEQDINEIFARAQLLKEKNYRIKNSNDPNATSVTEGTFILIFFHFLDKEHSGWITDKAMKVVGDQWRTRCTQQKTIQTQTLINSTGEPFYPVLAPRNSILDLAFRSVEGLRLKVLALWRRSSQKDYWAAAVHFSSFTITHSVVRRLSFTKKNTVWTVLEEIAVRRKELEV